MLICGQSRLLNNMKNKQNQEDNLKETILLTNRTFGSAFKATLGFYLAQTLVTLAGVAVLGVIGVVVYLLLR